MRVSCARGMGIVCVMMCRTLLEKLEPLELKMKSYIDTVVNPQQDASASNPLTFHANMDDFDVSSSEEEEKPQKAKKDAIYHPPKIAAVLYSEKGFVLVLRVRGRCGS